MKPDVQEWKPPTMAETPAQSDYLRDPATLARRKTTNFQFRPDAAELERLRDVLNVSSLKKVSFSGALSPAGRQDWRLDAKLGATVVQPCTVTLEPVTTRIDADVERRFMAEMPEPNADPGEDEGSPILEDDTLEPLGREIDLWAVMEEALALNIPDYPRADGAHLGSAQFTEAGKDAMTDDDTKPFAGLAALKDRLSGSE